MSYNKNLKLYVQNVNKTSAKEYYHQSQQLYLNEIFEINRKIVEEGVPVGDMIDEIDYILNKYKIFKNKERSNAYLTLINLKETVTYKSERDELQIIITDLSENLQTTTELLEEKTKQLEDCLAHCGGRRGFRLDPFEMTINTKIKHEYTIYIKEYGMPEDGIFLETILELIRRTM
jgi:hypothetical protein